MPPVSSKDSDDAFVDKSEPYYTNEDVAILHDIVVYAEDIFRKLPERERLPTNALFRAYYEILPTVGINADHDSRYARILFKIGGTKANGSLYEKFEDVLLRMGIEIQFDQDEDTDDDSHGEGFGGDVDDPANHIFQITSAHQSHDRRRRNSESSVWELGSADGPLARRLRSHSPLSMPSATDFNRIQDRSGAELPELGRPASSGPGTAQSISTRVKFTSRLELKNEAKRSSTLREDPNIRPLTKSNRTHEAVANLSRSDDLGSGQEPRIPPRRDSAVSEHLDTASAHHGDQSAFCADRLRNGAAAGVERDYRSDLTRRILYKWRTRTFRSLEGSANLELLAKQRDKQILIRQAFDAWTVKFREHQQVLEIERFFAHLGRRAARARELFLLAKAFTHWAQTTSDEVQRTSVARRHILRTRYFKAWREITAVNELKVRRFIIRRLFSTWRGHHQSLKVDIYSAITLYEDNLVEKIFWAWFWTFCNRRAPAWWADRLTRRQFSVWNQVLQAHLADDDLATAHQNDHLKYRTLRLWMSQQLKVNHAHRLGDVSVLSGLQRRLFSTWQKRSLLQSIFQKNQKSILRQRALRFLDLWTLRARQEKQSKVVDDLRIKREALISWSDVFRSKMFMEQVNSRLGQQILYKWIISERMILARRLVNLQAQQHALTHWMQTVNHRYLIESRDIAIGVQFNQDRRRRNALQKWSFKVRSQTDLGRSALQFCEPRALQAQFTLWRKSQNKIEELLGWAKDGEFYLLTKKTLKRWKDATDSSKRQKRHVAYSKIRRKNKMNLAAKFLSEWKDRASTAIILQAKAVEFHVSKNNMSTVDTFNQWRAQLELLDSLGQMQSGLVLSRHLNQLRVHLCDITGLNFLAIDIYKGKKMSLCVKIWVRLSLQRGAQQHLGSELREKNIKRVTRKILVHWHQCLQRSPDLAPSAGAIGKARVYGQPWIKAAVDTLSVVDSQQNIEDRVVRREWVTSAPAPAYLSTPTRRIMKYGTAGPSTTPSAPLPSPFERRLRAQYLGSTFPGSTSGGFNEGRK